MLQPSGPITSRKKKLLVFSPEQRAFIGKYAAENSNSAAVKKFKASFENGLGESTLRRNNSRSPKSSYLMEKYQK